MRWASRSSNASGVRYEADAPLWHGLGEAVDQALVVFARPAQGLPGEHGAGAVTQQPFQATALLGGDAHRGVPREPAPGRAVQPGLDRLGGQQAAGLEQAQGPLAHRFLDLLDVRGIQGTGRPHPGILIQKEAQFLHATKERFQGEEVAVEGVLCVDLHAIGRQRSSGVLGFRDLHILPLLGIGVGSFNLLSQRGRGHPADRFRATA